MLLVLLAVGVTSLSAIGNSPETSQALDRADALRQKGKWVQALSAYRQALTMPLTVVTKREFNWELPACSGMQGTCWSASPTSLKPPSHATLARHI